MRVNIPVVQMAQQVMILTQALSICEGHWKGWTLEIETLLGPEMATSEAETQQKWDLRGNHLTLYLRQSSDTWTGEGFFVGNESCDSKFKLNLEENPIASYNRLKHLIASP